MVSSEILKSLKEKDLSDIEEIKYKKGFLLVKFFYDFDKDELAAAKAYADEEETYESESEEWYKELYLPYLYDIALDNVEEIIDEVMEEEEVEGQFLAYDLDINNPTYGEFVALFNDIDEEKDIEEVMDELGL
ncbi:MULTISPECIES: hypothetical protein [Clostridium]|uniref:Uncharacterized protein n=1 Tax=Clostridium paridis TaxID=2803863 RepID=A0A937FFC8_9CLOT|nr:MULTISPECIES: hypothetical protein [Clostridium]MBL4932329.1 hypothetical protein [Clostridium paridis]MDD7793027.1 hypothetical protein [Clostridium sp. 'White wine YQ']